MTGEIQKFPSLTLRHFPPSLALKSEEFSRSSRETDIPCSIKEKLSSNRMDPFELSESLKVEAPLSRVIPLYPATLTHFARRCRINRRYDSQESLLVISLQRSALSLKDGSCLHPRSATFLHLPTRDILYPSFEFASFARILPPLPPFPPSSNVKRSFDGTKLIIRAKGRKEKRRREKIARQSMTRIHHGGLAIFLPLFRLVGWR